ncbi:MAG TPA: hypothetical protein VGV87_30455 [Blastocatellia bacterium]|jgi:hypothetical protein|nr:hypothetical protein [Blastocatellia bacterium]
MKVCPLCSESFGNELNFCDVDGAKLKRDKDASTAGEQSKLWQLLGVGLLLGALVLSAASIFLPKARVIPATAVSSTSAEPASNRSVSNDSANKAASSPAVSDEIPASTDEIALAETRRREKALALASQNSSTPGPNPKAAALAAEEGDKVPPTDQVPKQPPALLPVASDGTASGKSVSETREPPAPPKAVPAVAEPKEPRKPAETKSPIKDSSGKKKGDDKDKEKKGGFLRVFKKIFGKD